MRSWQGSCALVLFFAGVAACGGTKQDADNGDGGMPSRDGGTDGTLSPLHDADVDDGTCPSCADGSSDAPSLSDASAGDGASDATALSDAGANDGALDAATLGDASAGDGASDASTAPDGASDGGACPAGSNFVYTWGLDNHIYSFDPTTKAFAMVATPDCDASNANSIAIDRNLVAWLNYLTPGTSAPNDHIYKFDLTKGSGCTASGIQIPSGFAQVGMAFSTDTAGGSTETLYVDGTGSAGLARVDMTAKSIVPIGDFSNDAKLTGQSCDLTGTGSALLYGFFITSPYVRVAQLNPTTGDALSDTQLSGFAPPTDWAFSLWGGDFYFFAYPNASNSPYSSVIQYNPASNALNLAYVANAGFTVIAAGVSTCAAQ